jgi:hypothetical protein
MTANTAEVLLVIDEPLAFLKQKQINKTNHDCQNVSTQVKDEPIPAYARIASRSGRVYDLA